MPSGYKALLNSIRGVAPVAGPAAVGAPGTLPGAPGVGGSVIAGQQPQVPDPNATALAAVLANLGNLGNLGNLFKGTGSIQVPNYPALSTQQSSNINSLLASPDPRADPQAYYDTFRRAAETGTARGIAGSPLANETAYRMTDEERLRRQGLGTNMLSQALAQANAVLPLPAFMTTPDAQQSWQWLANLIKSAPDPEAARQEALRLAQVGINQGYAGSGGNRYAGGGGGTYFTPNIPSIPQANNIRGGGGTMPVGYSDRPGGTPQYFPESGRTNPWSNEPLAGEYTQPGDILPTSEALQGEYNLPGDIFQSPSPGSYSTSPGTSPMSSLPDNFFDMSSSQQDDYLSQLLDVPYYSEGSNPYE